MLHTSKLPEWLLHVPGPPHKTVITEATRPLFQEREKFFCGRGGNVCGPVFVKGNPETGSQSGSRETSLGVCSPPCDFNRRRFQQEPLEPKPGSEEKGRVFPEGKGRKGPGSSSWLEVFAAGGDEQRSLGGVGPACSQAPGSNPRSPGGPFAVTCSALGHFGMQVQAPSRVHPGPAVPGGSAPDTEASP